MVVYVDIDETICHYSDVERKYENAKPYRDRIRMINELYYDTGHIVVYWTARGTTTGIDWRDLTEKQLRDWGAKYHDLILKKPQYDLFIDDKAINTYHFFGKIE